MTRTDKWQDELNNWWINHSAKSKTDSEWEYDCVDLFNLFAQAQQDTLEQAIEVLGEMRERLTREQRIDGYDVLLDQAISSIKESYENKQKT